MQRFRPVPLAALLLAASLLCACSVFETPRTQRGNKVDPDMLKELVIGTSTKSDATSLLGSPTARATFDDNNWLYISELTRTRVGRMPGVLDQTVTVLTFDDGGVLRGIKRLNQEDGLPITTVSRTTPSPGSEASFMQQLLGNIGKFSPGPTPGSGGNGLSAGPSGQGI